ASRKYGAATFVFLSSAPAVSSISSTLSPRSGGCLLPLGLLAGHRGFVDEPGLQQRAHGLRARFVAQLRILVDALDELRRQPKREHRIMSGRWSPHLFLPFLYDSY